MKRKRGQRRVYISDDQLTSCLSCGCVFFVVAILLVFTWFVFANSTEITTTGVVVGKHYNPSHTMGSGKTATYHAETYTLDLRTERNGYISVKVNMNEYYQFTENDQIVYSYRYGKWGLGGKFNERVKPLMDD